MTFKKTSRSQWKMNHENYTAYIWGALGGYDTIYYLTITIETFDGQHYETKQPITDDMFFKLNEAKRFAKEFINSNN